MNPRQRTGGFTLIELLVVMVIIAILATMAVVSLGALGRDPPAKDAAQHMADLANLAAQQAVMQGQEYGLRIEPHAYSFYVFDGHRWVQPQADSLFRRYDLGADVNLTLELEGTPAQLAPPPVTVQSDAAATSAAPAAATTTGAPQDESDKPQVLLLSSGELPPFQIQVSSSADAEHYYTVKGSMTDGITLVAPDDAQAKP